MLYGRKVHRYFSENGKIGYFPVADTLSFMEPQTTITSPAQHAELAMMPSEIYIREIFCALSNADCYQIFRLASTGIDASSEVLGQHHFSKKRYYVRLRQLIKLGVIQKSDGRYVLTTLGRTIFDTTRELEFRISHQRA